MTMTRSSVRPTYKDSEFSQTMIKNQNRGKKKHIYIYLYIFLNKNGEAQPRGRAAGVKIEDTGNTAPAPGSAPGRLGPAAQVTSPRGASAPSPVKREAGPDSRASCGGQPGRAAPLCASASSPVTGTREPRGSGGLHGRREGAVGAGGRTGGRS